MKRLFLTLSMSLFIQLSLISQNLYGGSSFYYYDTGPCCGGTEERYYPTIPTPKPHFEDSQRNCRTEEYVCGQTCWDGSYDGNRARQGMGYCIEKTCTRTICD